jgi:hypothetical protein
VALKGAMILNFCRYRIVSRCSGFGAAVEIFTATPEWQSLWHSAQAYNEAALKQQNGF